MNEEQFGDLVNRVGFDLQKDQWKETFRLVNEAVRSAEVQLGEAKTLIADWLQHECSVGGPSWKEIESRARAMVAEKPAEQLPVISIRGGGMPLSIETGSKEPFKMPLCDVQVGCFGQCGKLLPCEDHPEKKDAAFCTCTPGGGGLCEYCRRQDLNMG